MDLTEALDALKPFDSTVPRDALAWLQAHWSEAEGPLLAAMDERRTHFSGADRDARFLYALFLCAEMRCPAAFPRYLVLCRLPNAVLDHVLGDILTESMPDMLARTCAGRMADLQGLIEDPVANEYARGIALEALLVMMRESEIGRDWLAIYCVALLRGGLERRPSFIWDSVVAVAATLQADGALPLIEKAYARGLADPGSASLESIRSDFAKSPDLGLECVRTYRKPWAGVEPAMRFFVEHWGREAALRKPEELLNILEKRSEKAVSAAWGDGQGRNDPCPCGSGRKFKKCCMGKASAPLGVPLSANHQPIREEHRAISDWMEAGYLHLTKDRNAARALECWKIAWRELLLRLPATLLNPEDAEATGAFEGHEFLDNWLQDFQMLLMGRVESSLDAAEYALAFFGGLLTRFPAMPDLMRGNLRADLARCLALSGKPMEALALAEALIADAPNRAQGYVLLAEMRGEDAAKFNMRPDVSGAIACLKNALERAEDCEDYDVALRLSDLETWRRSDEEPW